MLCDLKGDIEKFDLNGYDRMVVRYSSCKKAYHVHENKNSPLEKVFMWYFDELGRIKQLQNKEVSEI